VTSLILASGNSGKLRELAALLSPFGFELLPQTEFGIQTPPETGATFVENALLKARNAARLAGKAALADDSGIEVDALGGRPGVYSARYAGEAATDQDNLDKMLGELSDVPPVKRSARYRCAIVLVRDPDDPEPLIAQGAWEGRITRRPRGSGGFGYDPIFLPAGFNFTAAQVSVAVKNAESHRGQALKALLSGLRTARRLVD
jgi:XTP/dITP diphosphohydrolase